jgi:hypothetical protein
MPHQSDSGVTGAIKRPAAGSALKKSGLSATEVRALLYELKLRLMAGDDHETIRSLLGVTVGRYNELKRELYRQEQAEISGKTTEDVFLEYKWAQEARLRELDDAIKVIPENQPNALVGAIKAKSDIIDKILKTGQDLGVINKEPERKVVIQGHVIAQLNNNDLRKLIVQETNSLAGLLDKYGDADMDDNPIDAEGPSFTDQGKTGMNMAGPVKAASARASRVAVKRQKSSAVIDVETGDPVG